MDGSDCNSPRIKSNSSIIINAGNSSQNKLAEYLEMADMRDNVQLPSQPFVNDENIIIEDKIETTLANGETEIIDDGSSDDSNGETFIDKTTNKITSGDTEDYSDYYAEEGHKTTESAQVKILLYLCMIALSLCLYLNADI